MPKCEVIDLTLSDCDSDGDFIQSKKAIHPFMHQASVYFIHQVSVTSSFYHNRNCFTGFVHVQSTCKYCSLTKSARLILHKICQKLKVSLHDDTLSEVETIYWL